MRFNINKLENLVEGFPTWRKSLNEYEINVVERLLQGESYKEIAEACNQSYKMVVKNVCGTNALGKGSIIKKLQSSRVMYDWNNKKLKA